MGEEGLKLEVQTDNCADVKDDYKVKITAASGNVADEEVDIDIKITSDCDCNVVTYEGAGIDDFDYFIPFELPAEGARVTRELTFTETEVDLGCLDFSIVDE